MNLTDKIQKLKREKKAVILAHNYQRPEIQDVADYVGDSIELSRKAMQENQADIIVFAAVDFMAESATILNPKKKVLLPTLGARCPMAQMLTVDEIKRWKTLYPTAPVVLYVNTLASAKAYCDVCCTSANAVKVIKSVESDTILFVPDSNLGLYAQRFVPEKKFIFWPGYCHVHQDISVAQLERLKADHPKAKVLVHPECSPDVIDSADHVFSTEGMVKHCTSSSSKEFIIGTEEGLVYRLQKENPDKIFHSVPDALCPNMKKITLENVREALRSLEPRVELSAPSRWRGRSAMPRSKVSAIVEAAPAAWITPRVVASRPSEAPFQR